MSGTATVCFKQYFDKYCIESLLLVYYGKRKLFTTLLTNVNLTD